MTANIYRLLIRYREFENEIWRTIDISENSTLAKLAYTIMGSFNCNATHSYAFNVFGNMYFFYSESEDNIYPECIKLKELSINCSSEFFMIYDFGCDQFFDIKVIDKFELEKGTGTQYPKIVDGAGHGIIDDMFKNELRSELKKKKKNKNYAITYYNFNDELVEYDINDFSIEEANKILKRRLPKISFAYSS